MNACTAILGYSAGLFCLEKVSSGMDMGLGALIFLAVFVLSGGAAALNNYQDRSIDSRMKRTCRRPVPQGLVRPKMVLIGSLILLGLSLASLAVFFGSLWAVLVALAAVFLYNGLYTPLKKRTLFAFLPGLLSGALPPVIGWIASGAAVSISVFLYMTAVLVLWQMPHFWLLMLSGSFDNTSPVLPSFYSYFSRQKLAGLSIAWIVSLAGSILLLPLFLVRHLNSPLSQLVLLVIVAGYALALVAVSICLLKGGITGVKRKDYLVYNVLGLLFTVSLSAFFLINSFLI